MRLSRSLARLVPLTLLLVPAGWLLLFAARHQPPLAQSPQPVPAPPQAQTRSQASRPVPLPTPSVTVAPVARPSFAPPKAFVGTVVRQVRLPPGEKLIALTFDDGPWPATTEAVLKVLGQYHAKATFFWIGKNLEKFPQIAQQVVQAGHAVGDHTWSHTYRAVDTGVAAQEIGLTAALITHNTEATTRLFRPPGGNLKNGLAKYALSQGYTVVMWSVSSADTDRKAPWTAFAQNVLKSAKPGAIVLMHDGGGDRSRTVQALPVILASLQQQGYRFVSVPELLAAAQPEPKDAGSKALPYLQARSQLRTPTH